MSREKDREIWNAAAIRSAETLLVLLKNLISDQILDNATCHSIREIVSTVERPEATLVFGGHFKAGKSSTLNAALGRTLLPSGRLPETGVICSIRSGIEDSATVRCSGQAIPVDCSMEMIRSVCSVVDRETGCKRDLSNIERIEVAVQGTCIPENLIWIDSPGITDEHAMDECARRAAAEADLLVWVLWTKHPVGEPETAFLRRHLNERGAASVVFLLNCFLAEDRQDLWDELAHQDVPRIWKKLEEAIGPMGFSDDVPLVMIPMSARAIRDVDQNAFGGSELRDLLRQFDSPRHPRFLKTRWHRASMALGELADTSQRRLESVRQENERLGAQLQLEKNEASRAEMALLQTVRGRLREFFLAWSMAAREVAQGLSAELTLLNLCHNGGKHGLELARRVNGCGDIPYFDLCQAVERDLIERGCQPVPSKTIEQILEPLRSHSLENDVPKVELKPKAWSAFGGATGIVVFAAPPVGLAMMLGGGVIAAKAARKQLDRIRQSISAVTEKFILELERRLDEMAARFAARFSICMETADGRDDNREAELQLETLSKRLRTLAEEARKVSDGFLV
jgi:hypothetical protein